MKPAIPESKNMAAPGTGTGVMEKSTLPSGSPPDNTAPPPTRPPKSAPMILLTANSVGESNALSKLGKAPLSSAPTLSNENDSVEGLTIASSIRLPLYGLIERYDSRIEKVATCKCRDCRVEFNLECVIASRCHRVRHLNRYFFACKRS